jgi:hypothetical protein
VKIVSGDRGWGRTTWAVDWLLQGEPINSNPWWNRLIVCIHESETERVLGQVHTASMEWERRLRRLPVGSLQMQQAEILANARASVVSLNTYTERSRGIRMDMVEVCIDNFDMLLHKLGVMFPPKVLTVTNWELEQLPDPRTNR